MLVHTPLVEAEPRRFHPYPGSDRSSHGSEVSGAGQKDRPWRQFLATPSEPGEEGVAKFSKRSRHALASNAASNWLNDPPEHGRKPATQPQSFQIHIHSAVATP